MCVRLQVLYLPSLWYHYVRQRCYPFGEPVLAVNFWYDMPFDCKAAYAMMWREDGRRFRGCTSFMNSADIAANAVCLLSSSLDI